jgi:GWxTD domain-containing protein
MVFSEVPDSLFLFYNPQVKVMIPGEKTIEYNFPSELRPKINAECKLAWLIDGKWDSVKVGFEQVFILYSGTYSLKHQLEQIRYIASQNEWKYLKSLKNDPDKTRGIENFWAHYQDGDSNHNSIRTIFYSRVIEADRMFSFKRYKKGWMTDRGRVFIKYGPPDEIISDPLPLESRPYIIWYYYSLNKKFLFEDVKGFGDYELNNIQDED